MAVIPTLGLSLNLLEVAAGGKRFKVKIRCSAAKCQNGSPDAGDKS